MFGFPFDSQITGTDEAGLPIYDRASNSEQLATLIRSFFTNGIFGTGGFDLTHNGGLNYTVSGGKALCEGRFGWLTEPFQFTVGNGGAQNRIDTLVIRMNLSLAVRGFEMAVVRGVANDNPEPPALTRTDTVWELGIYNIPVDASSTATPISRVVDTRLDPERCGYVVAAMETFDTSTFYNQIRADLQSFQNREMTNFLGWFQSVQQIMMDTPVGNLMQLIYNRPIVSQINLTINTDDWQQSDDEFYAMIPCDVDYAVATVVDLIDLDELNHAEMEAAWANVYKADNEGTTMVFTASVKPDVNLAVGVTVWRVGDMNV